MNVENNQSNLEGVHVYWVSQCEGVAATSLQEAFEWYKSYTGLDEEDIFEYDEIEEVDLKQLVQMEEGNEEMVSVRSILEELWKGEPIVVISRY